MNQVFLTLNDRLVQIFDAFFNANDLVDCYYSVRYKILVILPLITLVV